jgi:hypothetical protein
MRNDSPSCHSGNSLKAIKSSIIGFDNRPIRGAALNSIRRGRMGFLCLVGWNVSTAWVISICYFIENKLSIEGIR